MVLITLRFFDLRKDGVMEFGGNSFSLGLNYNNMCKCFLMMRPTSGRFGLNVVTNGNNFFVAFLLGFSKSPVEIVEAMENWSSSNLKG